MTQATTHTHVGHAHGLVNNGSGDVYYIQGAVQETLHRLGRHGRDPRAVGSGNLLWLRGRFVPPAGCALARRRLRERGSVAVSGPPGSGRRTTALMLLHELAPDGTGVHEVDTGDGEGEGGLETETIGRHDRLLLDLSESDTTQFLRVQGELTAFRAVVERREARLVVVLPAHAEGLIDPELRPLQVRITRPAPRDLLARYLRQDGITPSAAALDEPTLVERLATAPLAEAAELAHLIGQARDTGTGGDFADWLAIALRQLTGDAQHTATFVAGLPSGRHRALALTVALLHGATPETVHGALDALLRKVPHSGDERPRLDRADLTAELGEVKAGTGPAGLVTFEVVGRDTGVLHHFWTYYPDLRARLQTWAVFCARGLGLDGAQRAALIDRFTGQVLRTGQPERLLDLARDLAGTGPSQHLVPDATQALAGGLEHASHGRTLRRLILEQVRARDLSAPFRLALTLACAQVMAVRHPDQALVRLHHLARAEIGHARRPALESLLDLAAAEPRLCRHLLHRLVRHVGTGTDTPHAARDRWIFLALAEALATGPGLVRWHAPREPLATGWADVLAHLPSDHWAASLRHWLTAALDAETALGDLLLTTLAAAGAASPRAVGRMYATARTWARHGPEPRRARRQVTDRFRQALDTAQGLGPAHPAPPTGPEPRVTESTR